MKDWRLRLSRYLERYAETDAHALPARSYTHVLTIPAYDEAPDFPDRLLATVSEDVLLVVVANVPDDAPAAARARTRAMAKGLAQRPDVLLIDRSEQPLPKRQGVGLARKLAADTATRLIAQGQVTCPVVFMTDADVRLPADYFEVASDLTTPATLLYPFRHEATEHHLEQRVGLYELHLAHYVLGLASAGSPYAYQSLGSTIAMHAAVYAAVRGVPRRNAGEDFYLLNKAAKVAPVIRLDEPELRIAGRGSKRVPFGTGPALLALPDDPESFASYPPSAFTELMHAQRYLESWALAPATMPVTEPVPSGLQSLGWYPERFARGSPPGPRRLRRVLEWFDAFRTMRFVREWQRNCPDARLLAVLRDLWAMPGAPLPALLEEAHRRLPTGPCGVGVHPAERGDGVSGSK